MVKNLQYFQEEENRFCEEHPDYNEFYYDSNIGEMSIYGIDDPLLYLSDRIFSKETDAKPMGNEIEYGFNDAQIVFLRLFYGRYSYIFRDDYYGMNRPDFVQNLLDTLDDMIAKAPQNTDPVLYRFCTDYDQCDMHIGDEITIPHNLTCTNEDWQQDNKNVYIITPLQNGKTRAHNLFEIYHHGDEHQVDFLRGTIFKVTDILGNAETGYRKFYLEEMEQ